MKALCEEHRCRILAQRGFTLADGVEVRTAPALWSQPRFLVGLLLVLGSALLGAQILASADDSVSVWTVEVDVAAGQEITEAMLSARQVRFADAQQADRYLPGDQALPLPAVAARPVGAGELLPRGALGVADRLVEVPLQVSIGHVPATVRVGNLIDVWVSTGPVSARSVLHEVPVLALEESDTGVRVVVGLDADQAATMPSLLGQIDGATVFVVRRPAS